MRPNFAHPFPTAEQNAESPAPWPGGGVDGFLAAVSRLAGQYPPGRRGSRFFILQAGEAFAFIRWHDVGRPLRFLKQMAGSPPLQFGPKGFRPELVDDQNPARHYIAFVCLGYWLPRWLAILGLWLWEVAGAVRYGFWASHDLAMGYVGIEHGRAVRAWGPTILPSLIAADLAAAPPAASSPEERDLP